MDHAHDIELIERVLKGEASAYKVLVERYQNYVFTIVLRILKDWQLAEEVAQDVFLKAYKRLNAYEQRAKFSSWLYAIAYRSAIDKKRLKPHPAAAAQEDGQWLALPDHQFQDPQEAMETHDRHALLHEAIQRLKPEDAALITLFYFEELSVQEVAQALGLTETNVKTKLHRIRERLRHQLAPVWDAALE